MSALENTIVRKKKSKDSLGDRMKDYEDINRFKLARRSYTIIRVDGKAFHTYTKGLERPFDDQLIQDMDETAIYLCQNIMGAKFAYVQSDEISILLTDFGDIDTTAWFDNNVQKMSSIAASMATSRFNRLRYANYLNGEVLQNIPFEDAKLPAKDAEFDARVFQLPQRTEVFNYFIWRQQDTVRNSITSVAQSLYSHKELMKKDSNQKQEMIFQKGINWNDYPAGKKRGRFIEKNVFINGDNFGRLTEFQIGEFDQVRTKWTVVDCPTFTQDRNFLDIRVPVNE